MNGLLNQAETLKDLFISQQKFDEASDLRDLIKIVERGEEAKKTLEGLVRTALQKEIK